MSLTAQQREKELLENIVEETGHDLESWIDLLDKSGETKTNALIKYIKTNHGLNHLQANILTGVYLNDGKPVYDFEVMFEKLFEGIEHQLPLYREIEALIQDNMPEVNLYPTKTYMSIDGERCIGAVKINKTNIRVGMDLGDRPFDGYVQKAKSLGTMPRISHMIELTEPDEVNDNLLQHLEEAYQNVHG